MSACSHEGVSDCIVEYTNINVDIIFHAVVDTSLTVMVIYFMNDNIFGMIDLQLVTQRERLKPGFHYPS